MGDIFCLVAATVRRGRKLKISLLSDNMQHCSHNEIGPKGVSEPLGEELDTFITLTQCKLRNRISSIGLQLNKSDASHCDPGFHSWLARKGKHRILVSTASWVGSRHSHAYSQCKQQHMFFPSNLMNLISLLKAEPKPQFWNLGESAISPHSILMYVNSPKKKGGECGASPPPAKR